MRQCIVCGKTYTNPGRRCNACRCKQWKKLNREKDLEQRRIYNKKRWARIKPIVSEKHCEYCGKVFMPNRYTPKQPYCSSKCRITAYRLANRDKINSRRRDSYQRYRFKKAETDALYKDKIRFGGNRILALERDNHLCQRCGSGDRLIVHHIDKSGQSDYPNNKLDNLQTLCRSCHISIHKD